MGLNFYGYDGLQPKTTPPKHISRQCNTHFLDMDLNDQKKEVLLLTKWPKWHFLTHEWNLNFLGGQMTSFEVFMNSPYLANFIQ